MNAREQITVEQALDAAPGLLTANEIEHATGLDEKTVKTELKRIAGLGNLEHIPGRGRGVKSRYGLIARLQSVAGAQPATVALSEGEAPAEVRVDAAATAATEIAAPQYDPDAVGFDSDKRATAEAQRADAAERERDELLMVLADVRSAAGDPRGTIPTHDLAKHIREALELSEAHRQDVIAWEREMEKALDVGSPAMAAERINLLRGERDETVRQFAILKERHDSYEQAIGEIHRACADAGIPVGHVSTRVHKLAETVAALRETAHALAEDPPVDVLQVAKGYVIRVPKRRPRTLTKPESARTAALAAARSVGRADVFALVPIGSAVRGAEWKEA